MGYETEGIVDEGKYTWTCLICDEEIDLGNYYDIEHHADTCGKDLIPVSQLRSTREQMLMDVAKVVAKRGTCSRAQVGVVFAREGRILATGYNGAPRGMDHCVHESYYWTRTSTAWETPDWLLRAGETISLRDGSYYYFDGQTVSTSPGCTVVEHAERNAVAFAAREGIRLGESQAYCTHAPCLDCARSLLNVGITSLTYEIPYRLTSGVELLQASGIQVIDNSKPGVV